MTKVNEGSQDKPLVARTVTLVDIPISGPADWEYVSREISLRERKTEFGQDFWGCVDEGHREAKCHDRRAP
jgi:hypothetical protein